MNEKLTQQEIKTLLRTSEPAGDQAGAKKSATAKEQSINEAQSKSGAQDVPDDIRIKENPERKVDVKQVQFQTFDDAEDSTSPDNISLILDIPMQVTVELGRTKKCVGEILKLGPGSVIELDKLAGEPVDILVNGKPIAQGEVVVIDENFGVRVNDIISASGRIPRHTDSSSNV
jgi:flagellar motor switch protein FliN/FliY